MNETFEVLINNIIVCFAVFASKFGRNVLEAPAICLH